MQTVQGNANISCIKSVEYDKNLMGIRVSFPCIPHC